jgi:hypothetical protein
LNLARGRFVRFDADGGAILPGGFDELPSVVDFAAGLGCAIPRLRVELVRFIASWG